MRKCVFAAIIMLVSVGEPVLAQTNSIVNDYTPAEERAADAAARSKGYTPLAVTQAQAGILFLTARKGNDTYLLTVTPDHQVYANQPIIPPVSH